LGYGLEEIEILEYILRRGGATSRGPGRLIRRFILQGFFNSEKASLFSMLEKYYLESFGTKLLGFPKDHKNFSQQEDILENWSGRLTFRDMTLTDEAAALEDEING
jgi:hypothetical protein